ncbi:MAG TPA: hypothetical protein VNG13_16055 [Mycobacteriales bacterium]|nr:hypothetical protein [Mycobacteriales bacterium]
MRKRIGLLAMGAILLGAGCGGHSGPGDVHVADQVSRSAPGREIPPPWAAPDNTANFIRAAGLPASAFEGSVIRFTAHLDIVINDQPVAIPAYIGIDLSGEHLSPLHTFDTTGVLHVETDQPSTFTLGEFFTEWDVRLDGSCLGAACTGLDGTLQAYVDGRRYAQDPAGITITPHEEIALIFGPIIAVRPVPSSYSFPPGS